MLPTSKLSKWLVPHEKLTGFPFNSPGYDTFSASGVRCRYLLDNVIRLSEASTAAYFEVANGREVGHQNEESSAALI